MPLDEAEHELNEISPLDESAEGWKSEMPAIKQCRSDGLASERVPLTTADTAAGRDDSNSVDQRTVRKLDWILLPFLALLFLLNSLDKANIGNAETAGFTHDTGLSPHDVNISMAVFFFVFVLLQPVGAALGRYFGMRRYVPVCMTFWGLSTVLHIFVRKRWQLILLRIAIAVLESGFYPTTVSYLSLFYTRYQFAWRLGIFYGMAAVSGVLGGVLSWAVFSNFPGKSHEVARAQHTSQDNGPVEEWKSWEVLFLIEGCTTMTVAMIGFFWLPRSADTAWFLTPSECVWAEQRMRLDQQHLAAKPTEESTSPQIMTRQSLSPGAENDSETYQRLLDDAPNNTEQQIDSETPTNPITSDTGISRVEILSAFLNCNIWHLLAVNILSAIPATSFGVLLPILIKQLSPTLKLTPAASNLLAVPPFAFGAAFLFIFTAWSDRTHQRLIPILWGLILLIIGLTMAVLSPVNNYWLRYCSLCVLLSGSFIASPLTVAWLANNTPEPGKRAIMLGMNGWGNLAGVFMVGLFTPHDKQNGYHRSFLILLLCSVASFLGFVAFCVRIALINNWREQVIATWDPQAVAREQKAGDVPIPPSFESSLLRRSGIRGLLVRFGLDDQRRGDEKLTFRYGF